MKALKCACQSTETVNVVLSSHELDNVHFGVRTGNVYFVLKAGNAYFHNSKLEIVSLSYTRWHTHLDDSQLTGPAGKLQRGIEAQKLGRSHRLRTRRLIQHNSHCWFWGEQQLIVKNFFKEYFEMMYITMVCAKSISCKVLRKVPTVTALAFYNGSSFYKAHRKLSIQAVAPFIITWPCPMVRWKAGTISFAELQTKHVKSENWVRTCGRNCPELIRSATASNISSCIRDTTETHNTICFRMSFPLNIISGLDTSDHEPIQKRTGSRYLI